MFFLVFSFPISELHRSGSSQGSVGCQCWLALDARTEPGVGVGVGGLHHLSQAGGGGRKGRVASIALAQSQLDPITESSIRFEVEVGRSHQDTVVDSQTSMLQSSLDWEDSGLRTV